MSNRREKGTLLLALVSLGFGLSVLWRGRASWPGVVEITGGQATAMGIAFIVFAIALLAVRIRRQT